MSRFTVKDLPLSGLQVITRQYLGDSRGFLTRMFCAEELQATNWPKGIAQINHTYTARQGSIRGLHYQKPPHAEMKLVSCIQGEIWDVAVDLRLDSPTFLQWHAEHLSRDNGKALLIPEGFAHGFQAISDDCELIYLHSEPYAPRLEAGIRFDDPRIAIEWPLPATGISARDKQHPLINKLFNGIQL